MVKLDTDLMSGPSVSTSSPTTSAKNIGLYLAGASVVAWALNFAAGPGSSMIDSTIGSVTGGRLSSEGNDGVWDGI